MITPKKDKIIKEREGKRRIAKNEFFNQTDLKLGIKFEKEADIEEVLRRRKTYGEISDEQKFFILEHLCGLRDNKTTGTIRESDDGKQFQKVIERIREIYRNETNRKQMLEIKEENQQK